MNNRLAIIIRAVIAALILAFVSICVLFIPNFADYVVSEIFPCELTRAVICLGGVILAFPCVVMLAMALGIAKAVASDRVFTRDTAALILRISLILLIDCVLFLFAVIALFVVGELVASPLLALIDLIGFALAFLLRVLADYIRRAALLKEEVDATL